jgi:CheY-like chemotaxis protein
MPEGGVLTISARNVLRPGTVTQPPERFVEIGVADTGTGIPDEIKSRIFEPFFTTKQVGKGSGLGLSQAYGFAQQSGGAISVDSAVGKGTRIAFLLPAADEAASGPVQAQAGSEAERLRASGTILLVEDDHAVAELTSALLQHAGYVVVRAHSGPAALNVLRHNRAIDIVFSDVVMPGGMDGVELARAIRAEFPGTPVLLTTAFGHRIADPRQSGIQVVRKPYDPTEVMTIIDGLIDEAKRAHPSPGQGGDTEPDRPAGS